MRRARAWAEAAALRIWVVDGAACDGTWREAADLVRPGDLLVLNKADLLARVRELPRDSERRAAACEVLSIPTMILFRGGQPVKRVIGAYPKKKLEAQLFAEV